MGNGSQPLSFFACLTAIANLLLAAFTGFFGILGLQGRLMDAGAGENQGIGAFLVTCACVFLFNAIACCLGGRVILSVVFLVNATPAVVLILKAVVSGAAPATGEFVVVGCLLLTAICCWQKLIGVLTKRCDASKSESAP